MRARAITLAALLLLCLIAAVVLFAPLPARTPTLPTALPVATSTVNHAVEKSRATPATQENLKQKISLTVSGITYADPAPAPESVLTLMQHIASSTTRFTFTSKTFPSLGVFIESINGTPNAGGLYWTLYINGIRSELGVSSAIVSPGDVVEWRFEK